MEESYCQLLWVMVRIADAAEQLEHGRAPELRADDTERHAITRLDQGFDLLDVVGELRALRRCLFKLFASGRVFVNGELREP